MLPCLVTLPRIHLMLGELHEFYPGLNQYWEDRAIDPNHNTTNTMRPERRVALD